MTYYIFRAEYTYKLIRWGGGCVFEGYSYATVLQFAKDNNYLVW